VSNQSSILELMKFKLKKHWNSGHKDVRRHREHKQHQVSSSEFNLVFKTDGGAGAILEYHNGAVLVSEHKGRQR
jgi:hypothetical protein